MRISVFNGKPTKTVPVRVSDEALKKLGMRAKDLCAYRSYYLRMLVKADLTRGLLQTQDLELYPPDHIRGKNLITFELTLEEFEAMKKRMAELKVTKVMNYLRVLLQKDFDKKFLKIP